MNKILKKLTEASGVSSNEKEIRLLIRDLIVEFVDDWRVDTMGNLIATKKGTGESNLRVMVDAHMDEVGFIVNGYDTDGTCKFLAVGGIHELAMIGKVVHVGPKKLTGVIGSRPVHLLKRGQKDNIVNATALRIDIGAKSKDEVKRKVKIGTTATFATKYQESGDVAFGKAFDDRAGCAALIEIIKRGPYPFDLLATFTVQEEVGLRGARAAAFGLEPDLAFVLECTPAYDLPRERDVSPNVSLGKGPSIYVMDRSAIQDPRLVAHIMAAAAEKGIPYQIRQPGGGGTNTASIQRSGAGVPTATIATPARYIHSPMSVINLNDYKNVIELAEHSLRGIPGAMNW